MVLPAEVVDLIASLRAEIVALRAEVAELRRRLGLDSSNSSKPPSSDGLGKKHRSPMSLRGRSGKRSGGQEGHGGGTLRQVADPDAVVAHEACACGHCGAALDPKAPTRVERRQVFDIPERMLRVTEHQASVYRCTRCGGVTKAAFPPGVASPAQYGGRIKAAAVYLNVQQLIPEDRAAQALSDLFGAPLVCPASVVAWVAAKARELAQVAAAIGRRVAGEAVRHLDETGYRIAGRLHWLHTTSSLAFTFYRAGEKRGDVPADLRGGTVVHDHFAPYRSMDGPDGPLLHAYCNAHILRELQGVTEFDKEPWAELMRAALLDANAAVNAARAAGASALPPKTFAALVERYWEAVRNGLAFHRKLPKLKRKSPGVGRVKNRPGKNLLERLKAFKAETLRFMTDFAVPFTNNLAEQDLRMMKVKMKISGCFRTLEGAKIFATLRSVVSTARKQGYNILQILAAPPNQVWTALTA
jgi:transposase